MLTGVPVTSGRWSEEEHKAFEDGLRTFGTNWRAIYKLVPTRTLTQIRTHAQKFFLKHGMPDKTQPEGNITSGEFTTSSGITMRPVATLRHVLLEPLHPLDDPGLIFRADTAGNCVVVHGFKPVTLGGPAAGGPVVVSVPPSGVPGSGSTPQPATFDLLGPGIAEECEHVRSGDIVLGISGVCVVGMDATAVSRVVTAVRAVTQGGMLVLHLSDLPIDASLVEEAALQMATSCSLLLGSARATETCQNAAYAAVAVPGMAVTEAEARRREAEAVIKQRHQQQQLVLHMQQQQQQQLAQKHAQQQQQQPQQQQQQQQQQHWPQQMQMRGVLAPMPVGHSVPAPMPVGHGVSGPMPVGHAAAPVPPQFAPNMQQLHMQQQAYMNLMLQPMQPPPQALVAVLPPPPQSGPQ